MSPFLPTFSAMDSFFPSMFYLIFAVVIGVFIFAAVRGIRQFGRNQASPRLTVDARVVSRRQSYTPGTDATVAGHTYYYATFEVASGDRMEFSVSGHEYGLLAEGDAGSLSFQGTRYQGFVRQGAPD